MRGLVVLCLLAQCAAVPITEVKCTEDEQNQTTCQGTVDLECSSPANVAMIYEGPVGKSSGRLLLEGTVSMGTFVMTPVEVMMQKAYEAADGTLTYEALCEELPSLTCDITSVTNADDVWIATGNCTASCGEFAGTQGVGDAKKDVDLTSVSSAAAIQGRCGTGSTSDVPVTWTESYVEETVGGNYYKGTDTTIRMLAYWLCALSYTEYTTNGETVIHRLYAEAKGCTIQGDKNSNCETETSEKYDYNTVLPYTCGGDTITIPARWPGLNELECTKLEAPGDQHCNKKGPADACAKEGDACNAGAGCVLSEGVCKADPCKDKDETECKAAADACAFDATKPCMDRCGSFSAGSSCNDDLDCAMDGNVCRNDPCKTLSGNTCKDGCVLMSGGACKTDPCKGLSDTDCDTTATCTLTGETDKVCMDRCGRLEKDDCKGGCAMDDAICRKDPCKNLPADDCKDSCVLDNNVCKTDPCKGLSDTDCDTAATCTLTGDTDKVCMDRCGSLKKDDCKGGCIVDGEICRKDPCSTLTGDTCKEGCVLDNNVCKTDPCKGLGDTDCDAAATCTLTGETDKVCVDRCGSLGKDDCKGGCAMDNNVCRVDPCSTLMGEDCKGECTLDEGVCKADPCRTFTKNDCKEGCVLDDNVCKTDPCKGLSDTDCGTTATCTLTGETDKVCMDRCGSLEKDDCKGGCAMDDAVCRTDPCEKLTGAEACEAGGCMVSGSTCQTDPCKGLGDDACTSAAKCELKDTVCVTSKPTVKPRCPATEQKACEDDPEGCDWNAAKKICIVGVGFTATPATLGPSTILILIIAAIFFGIVLMYKDDILSWLNVNGGGSEQQHASEMAAGMSLQDRHIQETTHTPPPGAGGMRVIEAECDEEMGTVPAEATPPPKDLPSREPPKKKGLKGIRSAKPVVQAKEKEVCALRFFCSQRY